MQLTLRNVFAATVVLALVSAPSIARSDPWMPLTTGTRWEYISEAGDAHQVQTITGQRIVRGRTVAVKSYAEGAEAGLENYWLLDADGSVLLAGFMNPSAGLARAYEPPIRFLPAPPASGPQPVQHIAVYDLITDAFLGEADVQLELALVQLSTPLYVVPVFTTGVGQPSVPAGQALTLDGRPLPSGAYGTATDFFINGVGEIAYQTSQPFGLSGFGLPTATASSSWGAIKRLYR